MDFNEKEFKLADYYKPALDEGKYTITGNQKVSISAGKIEDTFTASKDFYIAANTETISPDEIFSIYPVSEQQGDFSGTLPFIVLNNQVYPWIRHWTEDINGLSVPWLALIVISEDECISENDIKYSQLEELKENRVFFPYSKNTAVTLKDDDILHIFTISKDTCQAVMPSKEDLPWLTHAKFVNLSAAEDAIAEQDGWFSTIIANRFVPSHKDRTLKSTVHLISIDRYLKNPIPDNYDFVRFISIYHWNIYSEKTEDKSFVSLVNGLNKNSKSVEEKVLKPHYLRTGEKTYSIYHSPLLPLHSVRYDNMNGEEKYTVDGRLIYDLEHGIFDVSYSAAFNLGKLITLSRRSAAEKIIAWRKEEAIEKHINRLDSAIGLSAFDLKEICEHLTEEQLL